MRQCHGKAKAFCDEEEKWQTHKDDKSDGGRGEEHPKDIGPTTQDANKTVAIISEGYAASESKCQQKLTAQ